MQRIRQAKGRGRRWSAAVAYVALLSIGVVAAACDGDGEPSGAEATPGEVNVSQLPGQPAAGTSPEAAVERVQHDGVSFEYDANLLSAVRAGRPDMGANALPAPVVFTMDGDSLVGSGTLVVRPVRDASGSFYADLPGAEREGVEHLASVLSREERPSDFVNGSGTRSVRQSESTTAYRFNGLTTDSRYLVTLDLTLHGDSPEGLIAGLDELVRTIYVDGDTDALNIVTCDDRSHFVTDVTIPDATQFAPGEQFVKTWRIQNAGSCTWNASYSWAFAGGDVLTVIETSSVPEVAPGEEVDLSVTLRAPDEPGIYAGQWQLIGPDHFDGIGSPVYVLIEVTSE